MSAITFILLSFIFVWLLQLSFSYLQMRQFNRRVFALRSKGVKTAVGMAGNMYKRRVYAIVVVDSARQVVAAERLSGWTVFARPLPLPQIIGCSLEQLQSADPRFGISKKLWQAIQHASSFIVRGFANEEVDDQTENEKNKELPLPQKKIASHSPSIEKTENSKKGGEKEKIKISGYNVK